MEAGAPLDAKYSTARLRILLWAIGPNGTLPMTRSR